MRKSFVVVVACICALAAVLPASTAARAATTKHRPTAAAPDSLHGDVTARRVPGEVVVRYGRSLGSSARATLRARLAQRFAARVADRPAANIEVVTVGVGNVAAAAAEVEAQPGVVSAEPNFIYRAAATIPNDPRFSSLWALDNTGQAINGAVGTSDADIDAPEAWDATTGSDSVVVAVVDTGVAVDHPDLAGNVWTNPGETGAGKESNGIDDDANGYVDDWRGWDFVDNDNTPRDLVGHGTHVAGIIGSSGNNGSGATGVNWNVSIMPLRVLGGDGSGTTADVAAAFEYARDNGAIIANASLGGPTFSRTVADAIVAAPDVLFVAAAGNEAANNDLTGAYPCNYPSANVLCVAATDANDNLAGYSNYGAANVDLGAPGSRILATQPAFARTFHENFEADIAATWMSGGSGGWGRASDSFGYYLSDSPTGNYAPNTDAWIATASSTDLSGHVNCRLGFQMWLDTEKNADVFRIEASTDGSAWSHVAGYSGSTGGSWVSLTADLSQFDNRPLYLRLRFTSNALLESAGVALDELSVRCLASNFSGNEFAYASGTSMAAPHVAGVGALLVALAPDASVATLHNAIVSGVDPLPSLTGRTASGGRLNAAKALSMAAPNSLPDVDATVPPGGGGGGGTEPSPEPTETAEPSPSPSDSISPAPDPDPQPSIQPPALVEHDRSVTLELRRHLRLRGHVSATTALEACISGITLKVKRNGQTLRTITTDEDGSFKVRVRDRKGRYRVRAVSLDFDGGRCTGAASPLRYHRH